MVASVALAVRRVCVARDGRPVLRDVELSVARGETVALLGPSGAGKSTLVQAIAGLLPLQRGTITIDGRVGAALQGAAFAHRSVQANLDVALGWWGVPRAARPARIAAALERCAAQQLASRPATALSGGEATRVHLARAIAVEPDVLLLDEPFAGLDPVLRGELLADTSGVLRDAGRATVIVVHDRAEAWALADRIVVLLDGEVAADGTPHALLDAPPTESVAEFLGFSGALTLPGGGRLRLRPSHATLVGAGAGTLDGTIRSLLPEPDGLLARVATERGQLDVRVALPGPAIGATVGIQLTGGVSFDGARR
ncbi:MAG: ABC transporter ATP-binding protein [Patulibacter sp.]